MSHHLFFLEPKLASRVESSVVNRVIVTLSEDSELLVGRLLHGDHSVHYGNGFILYRIDNDISWYDLLTARQEKNISTVVRWLHASTIQQGGNEG